MTDEKTDAKRARATITLTTCYYTRYTSSYKAYIDVLCVLVRLDATIKTV